MLFFIGKDMLFVSLIIQFVLLVAGFVLLIKGADWFVDGAAGIADKLGIPQLVIGLTIVAFGTSAPEAAVSITAGLNGTAGLAVGNVVGSNIMNILLILGIASVITPIPVQKSTFKYEIPFVILITVIMGILGYIGGDVGRIDGVILWAIFLLFFVYLIKMSKSGQNAILAEEEESGGEAVKKEKKVWQLILFTIIGIAMIVVGSNLTVKSATAIATAFGMSDRLIGLTIVAFGTSLPELVTSAMAAKKGNADIAIGNIVGSNIFNILFVLGTTALITAVPFEPNFYADTIISALAAVLLLLCVANKDRKLKRWGGVTMLLCYAVYFVYLLMFSAAA